MFLEIKSILKIHTFLYTEVKKHATLKQPFTK